MSISSATVKATQSAVRSRAKAQASHVAALGDEFVKASRSSLGKDTLVVSKAARQTVRQTAKATGGAFPLAQIDINRELGAAREVSFLKSLQQKFPRKEGFVILPQAYLRDAEGSILKDRVTGEARRVDFMVLRKKSVVKSFEVTSMTAPKGEQLAKEARIRSKGGNFILNPDTQELISFPKRVQTKVWRLE